MIDLERFNREKAGYLELWTTPVVIQFGAVFEMVAGSAREPFYGRGVVRDIRTGESFKGDNLIREVSDNSEDTTATDVIGGGGDFLRTNILRMTGEILTVDQYIVAYSKSFLKQQDLQSERWQNFRGHFLELLAKGSRELSGRPIVKL